MARSNFVLIDSGRSVDETATALAALFGNVCAQRHRLSRGHLVNLGDLGDAIRGDVEEGFEHLGHPIMLALTDVAESGRSAGFLDGFASAVFDRIAAATPWRLALCLEDGDGDLVITRERLTLSATA